MDKHAGTFHGYKQAKLVGVYDVDDDGRRTLVDIHFAGAVKPVSYTADAAAVCLGGKSHTGRTDPDCSCGFYAAIDREAIVAGRYSGGGVRLTPYTCVLDVDLWGDWVVEGRNGYRGDRQRVNNVTLYHTCHYCEQPTRRLAVGATRRITVDNKEERPLFTVCDTCESTPETTGDLATRFIPTISIAELTGALGVDVDIPNQPKRQQVPVSTSSPGDALVADTLTAQAERRERHATIVSRAADGVVAAACLTLGAFAALFYTTADWVPDIWKVAAWVSAAALAIVAAWFVAAAAGWRKTSFRYHVDSTILILLTVSAFVLVPNAASPHAVATRDASITEHLIAADNVEAFDAAAMAAVRGVGWDTAWTQDAQSVARALSQRYDVTFVATGSTGADTAVGAWQPIYVDVDGSQLQLSVTVDSGCHILYLQRSANSWKQTTSWDQTQPCT